MRYEWGLILRGASVNHIEVFPKEWGGAGAGQTLYHVQPGQASQSALMDLRRSHVWLMIPIYTAGPTSVPGVDPGGPR